MTADNMLSLLGDPEDLAGYATQAAARELAQNWECALADGWGDDIIKSDIDDVIERLRRWGTQVRYNIHSSNPGGVLVDIS